MISLFPLTRQEIYIRLCVSLPSRIRWRYTKPIACTQAMVTKHQKQTSNTLLDRIDIHIEVSRADYEKLSGDRMGESSGSI